MSASTQSSDQFVRLTRMMDELRRLVPSQVLAERDIDYRRLYLRAINGELPVERRGAILGCRRSRIPELLAALDLPVA